MKCSTSIIWMIRSAHALLISMSIRISEYSANKPAPPLCTFFPMRILWLLIYVKQQCVFGSMMAFSRCIAAVRSHLGVVWSPSALVSNDLFLNACTGRWISSEQDVVDQNATTSKWSLKFIFFMFFWFRRQETHRKPNNEINLFYSSCEFPDFIQTPVCLLVWTTRKCNVTCGYGNACVWVCVWVLSRNWKRHSVCVNRPVGCSSPADGWKCHDKHQGAQTKSRSSTNLLVLISQYSFGTILTHDMSC